MENTQPMKTENGKESKVVILDALIQSDIVAVTEKSESTNLPPNTTATTLKDSTKIWTSAELAELESRVGLLAGALADFQTAGGIVAVKNIEYKTLSGSVFLATKLYLVVEGVSLRVKKTTDGLDFNLVAVKDEKVTPS